MRVIASRRVLNILLALFVSTVSTAHADPRLVTLQWDANTEADLAGYLVTVGTALDAPLRVTDVGLVTQAQIEIPEGTRFYVWVSAYSTAGLVSKPSAAITVTGGSASSSSTTTPAPDVDFDADGMPDRWEQVNNVQDPLEDRDRDGITAVDEYRRETDPNIPNRWVLGEGSQGQFEERIAFLNPGVIPANGTLTFRMTDGTEQKTTFTVPAQRRTTLELKTIKILAKRTFSVIVDVSRGGVIIERMMQWADIGSTAIRAGHAGKGMGRGAKVWYFADGDARDVQTALTITNDEATVAKVSAQFYRDDGTVVPWSGQVPARNRITMLASSLPELMGQGFWMRVMSDVPIIVERTVTWSRDGRLRGGHLTGGASATSRSWYLGDGEAGGGFATDVVIANPTPRATSVNISWLHTSLPPSVQSIVLQPNTRIKLDPESGTGLPLGKFAVAVEASDSVVVERAMYWPIYWWNDASNWDDGHASTASPQLGRLWLLAEGEVGGSRNMKTVLAIGNPGKASARLTVTFVRESAAPLVVTRSMKAESRLTVDAADVGLKTGERFGVVVESDAPIVVDRSLYWSMDGGYTIGGTNEIGYRVR